MIALEALLAALTLIWLVCTVWKHRHERMWQIGTLATLGFAYYLIMPNQLHNFTAVN